ncbi:MAG: ice-binding family protein [Patescibacteria group bacterium]
MKLISLKAITVLVFAVFMLSTPIARAAPTTVDLGTADPFAILSGTPNITDSPTSVITGNVGLYPAAGSGIGLLCSQVTGTIYARDGTGDPCFTVNDPLLLAAKNSLTTAYLDAAGRTPVTTVATELGGTTLVAGIYAASSTTFDITAGAGALVLNGQGDSSSVFIFEMNATGTGLVVGPGSTVSLTNGAQACNIFWRVDTATIDTTAVFKGNILALTSITVANGANIEGRLLARNGSVTLINDTITIANCATTTTVTIPGLPNTGGDSPNTPWGVITAVTGTALLSFLLSRRNRADSR